MLIGGLNKLPTETNVWPLRQNIIGQVQTQIQEAQEAAQDGQSEGQEPEEPTGIIQ